MSIVAILTAIGADPEPTILLLLHCVQKVFTDLNRVHNQQDNGHFELHKSNSKYDLKTNALPSNKYSKDTLTNQMKQLTMSVGLF